MNNHKVDCKNCGRSISTANIVKHTEACFKGRNYTRVSVCRFCGLRLEGISKNLIGSHIRWCNKNPNRNSILSHPGRNHYIVARELGLPIPSGPRCVGMHPNKGKPSPFKGKHHTEETKEMMRQKARASNHRRLKKRCTWYIKPDGTKVLLDSSWEEILARRLDFLEIDWIRPDPVVWKDDNGVCHKYFPDFYLPKYDLFLDPKNPYAARKQVFKIEKVKKIINLKVITSDEGCKTFNFLLDPC